ncbi:probable ATP-dependent DNA helicase HFM1 [Cololabis saira]|uniref:probable ATP-dependent DNA helicase HFM1 n=1 Tax=Cololabis saira TaxID=129043 RepID=UPI002AD3AF85|nr:probable ATP-dependent DNA helicase HFM1 [Cololabis saira]
MLDTDDCNLSLDRLFFEKPIVHKVKPLHQEGNSWQLKTPPPLSHIPTIQDIQEEAESLSNLYGFSQNSKKFHTPFTRSDGLEVFGISHNFYNDKRGIEGTQGVRSSSPSRCGGFQEGSGFRDYTLDDRHRAIGGDGASQHSGHANISTCLPLACVKNPPLRRSLFKTSELTDRGDSSTKDDLRSNSSSSCSQTASRPQTFLSRVAMTTVPLSLHPPQATVGHAVPLFPSKPPLSPPPLGSSAASGRLPQQVQHAKMQDKGTKRAFVPPMTPQPLQIQGSSGSDILRPVSEIPIKFRSIFSEFPFFNYVQSKALDDVLYTNKNFVVCAPTGSGKTVLFELAIIRLLMETPEPWNDVKAVYVAPIKALCSQFFDNWTKKFGPLGLKCRELTSDSEIDDFFEIQDSHIILTTPEKWDSMTRKWKDHCLLQLVRLFLIDEVHVVKDPSRGATLEVVVSRMKAVQAYRALYQSEAGLSMRFVAVSATIPNVSDIAEWLSDESGPATHLHMDESHRPVKLRKVVLGFPWSPNQSDFKFDFSLNYKMANIIQTYSDQKPALVFCSTRKGVQQSATILAKDARFILSIEHKQRLTKYANTILDTKLRDLVMLGIGYHHAGVVLSDRKKIEEAFILGDLPVLCTTSTLAMGVNLPAHLVVIKSTMHYIGGSYTEYSEADVLQMIGRAGRPQFDTSATAVIMTKLQTRDKYMKLMTGIEIIESSLHSHLVEHLNAEIVLQTISDVNMALDWIRSTFLYIRALKNPSHYGFSTQLDRYGIEGKLQELCLKNLNSLSSIDVITMDEDINIKTTEAGRLMARYYVAFETMKQFTNVAGTETLADLINLLSKSKEFSDINLRLNERRTLNTLNRDKNSTTIRFPLEGKIKSNEMKVNCLIQAQLGSIPIQDFGLSQDTARIFRNGFRICKCLSEFLTQRSKAGFSALLNSVILVKCFKAQLWENSHYVSKQLEKIGQTLSTAMVYAGLTTFSKIEETNARELELIVNRHPPFGNQIIDSITHLPNYDVTLEQLPRYSSATAEIVVKVNLKNQAQLRSRRTAPDHHYVSLIIGNADNTVVFLQRLTDSLLLKSGTWSKKIDVEKASKGDEISVNLISSEYVGLDIRQKFTVYYSGTREFKDHNPFNVPETHPGQGPQRSALMPSATHKESSSSAAKQDVGIKRQCNHFCKNKNLCAHDCCKVGVTVGRKRSAGQEFSSYLKDLRDRSDTLVQTPVKRLKLKMNEEAQSVSMQRFAYKPKDILLPATWCEQDQYEPSDTDLTSGDYSHLQDVVCLSDPDPVSFADYQDYVEDDPEMLAMPAQTPAAAHVYHHQRTLTSGLSRRMVPETSAGGLGSGWYWNHLNTSRATYSQGSSVTPEQEPLCRSSASLQIPNVSFDLGHECDDWDDFDDENLLHASETKSDPLIQRRVENNVSGSNTTSAAAFLSYSQNKTHITAVPTPLSSISPNTKIRKLGPSAVNQTVTPQKRLTLDLMKKRPNIFSEEIPVKAPENLPNQPHVARATTGLNFFYTSVPAPADSSLRSTEEEAFLGIFDGIF